MKDSGFANFYFYYPVPDYKLPKYVYSDEYLPKISDEIPANIAYDTDNYRVFNEQMVINTLKNTEDFKILTNSFLIEAVKL